MIITIDGFAGTGKSTVAKGVAEKLAFRYVDTGAFFRTIAWGVIVEGIVPKNDEDIASFLQRCPLKILPQNGSYSFFCGKVDATAHLRHLEVSQMSSIVSTFPSCRQEVLRVQHELAKGGKVVFEGRDMGTVVFPDAKCKIFLTATPEIRAHRRFLELQEKDPSFSGTEEGVLQEIRERDERDTTRKISPLKPARDAHIIDTSCLSISEVVSTIVEIATVDV
jgi:CMP/dCMP kinase